MGLPPLVPNSNMTPMNIVTWYLHKWTCFFSFFHLDGHQVFPPLLINFLLVCFNSPVV